MTLAEAIGQVVRAHRTRAGLNVRELAEACGMHRPNVARLKNAHAPNGYPSMPTIETLSRVGAPLGKSASDLLYEAEVNHRMGAA